MSRPLLIGAAVFGGLVLLLSGGSSQAAPASTSPGSSGSVTLFAGRRYRITASLVPGMTEDSIQGFRNGLEGMGNTIESLESDPTKLRVTFSTNAPLEFARTVSRAASITLFGTTRAFVIEKVEEIK